MNSVAASERLSPVLALDFVRKLWDYRELTFEFVKRDIRDRHAGQAFGVAWTIGHPVFLLALYVTLFTFVFRMKAAGVVEVPRDFTVYILAGLVPWLTFQEVLSRGCEAISSNDSLVKQIVFPVEILPVKVVLGSFVTQLVSLTLVSLYILASGNGFAVTYLLLPLLCVLQILVMVGVCYVLSAVGVFLRDIKDVITVFNAANLFLQPILYQPEVLPAPLKALIYANPFSHLVFCYQDVLYFGGFAHTFSWFVLVFASGAVLVLGYWFFRRLAPYFGNVL